MLITVRLQGGLFKMLRYKMGHRGFGTFKVFSRSIVISEKYALDLYLLLKYMQGDDSLPYNPIASINKAINDLVLQSPQIKYLVENPTPPPIKYSVHSLKFKPLAHQYGLVDKFEYAKKAYGIDLFNLSADVGSGKTYMSLYLSEYVKAKKIIIIAPKQTLQDVWINSIKDELFFQEADTSLYVVDKKTKYNNQKYIVATYENIAEATKSLPADDYFIIVDEVHNFASKSAIRTHALINFIDTYKINRGVVMSGTTITGKSGTSELVNMLKITSSQFRNNIKQYEKMYVRTNGTFTQMLVNRYKLSAHYVHLPSSEPTTVSLLVRLPNWKDYTLANISKDVVEYIKTRVDYFKKHKERYDTMYFKHLNTAKKAHISLNGEFLEYTENVDKIIQAYKKNNLFSAMEYFVPCNKFEQEFILPVLNSQEKKEFREAKSVYKYLALKLRGEALALVIGKARQDAHREMVAFIELEDIIESSKSKTLIFSKYIEICDTVVDRLEQEGYTPTKVYGHYTNKRDSALSEFNTGKSNPMVATYQSLGTGNRLTVASTTIFIDLPYTQVAMVQAKARTDRTGQSLPIHFYIVELDTGGEPNINSRNIDLVKINNDAIRRLTGIDLGSVKIDQTVSQHNLTQDAKYDFIVNIAKDSFIVNEVMEEK